MTSAGRVIALLHAPCLPIIHVSCVYGLPGAIWLPPVLQRRAACGAARNWNVGLLAVAEELSTGPG